jgi:hypothetical protein
LKTTTKQASKTTDTKENKEAVSSEDNIMPKSKIILPSDSEDDSDEWSEDDSNEAGSKAPDGSVTTR